jgi:hypothetical protein
VGRDIKGKLRLHLSLFGEEGAAEDLKNGVALLEALRRTSTRLGVFCQTGHIAPPKMAHVLYGLLAPMVVPVTAPLGGVFHPKTMGAPLYLGRQHPVCVIASSGSLPQPHKRPLLGRIPRPGGHAHGYEPP